MLRYNVYISMLYKVLQTFFLFLVWYSFFIIAFALGFYIMLHKVTFIINNYQFKALKVQFKRYVSFLCIASPLVHSKDLMFFIIIWSPKSKVLCHKLKITSDPCYGHSRKQKETLRLNFGEGLKPN